MTRMVSKGVAVVGVVAFGALAGRVATAGDESVTHPVRVGAVTLEVAGGWRAAGPSTLADGRRRMRVALAPASDPSLLPADLRTRGETPRVVRLGGYRAWSYGAVTVLPSTRGVVAVVCDPAPCATAVESLSIAGAAILVPAPDLALRLRAPAALARLDAARVSARAGLESTHVAAPAQRLAAAHDAALTALRPVANPALIAALADARDAYTRLADGASPAAFAAARDEVAAADRTVDDAVAGLARDGAPAVQRPLASAGELRGGPAVSTLALWLAVALLLAGAVASLALRRAGPRRPPPRRDVVRPRASARAAAEPTAFGGADRFASSPAAAEPSALDPRRAAPLVPPPAYGRWDDAPAGLSAGAAAPDGGGTRSEDYGVVVDNVNVSVLE